VHVPVLGQLLLPTPQTSRRTLTGFASLLR
jgi:hypothetical protein